jgi:ribosomal protein L11 methylase PrmA
MWVSVALETDAAHADSLSDALMAAGAISVSVEDAEAGTDAETPQFGEPGGTGGHAHRPCGTKAGWSRCSTRHPT